MIFAERQGSADLWGVTTMDTAQQNALAGAPESGIRQPAPDGRPASACSVVARPISEHAKPYHAWRDRLDTDPTCWKFSDREDAIAFAAFIAGWWLRTGDNPDEFFNPPNAPVEARQK
jgi:hypothetical protein